MVNPKIISPWLQQNGFLPTQKNLGSGPQSTRLNQTIPYYDKMISMILSGHARPSIGEYPQIAENVREAIEAVYYGIKEPKQALDDALPRICKGFRWWISDLIRYLKIAILFLYLGNVITFYTLL